MGRAPCCDKANVKKGPWSPEEDAKLKEFIDKFGTGGNWIALPQKAGLKRCGKSCRLRWLNYLRPNIKHGQFSDEEDTIICTLYASIGSRWSIIAAELPGRTDNDIKNYWNTKLKKKLLMAGINTINIPSSRFPHINNQAGQFSSQPLSGAQLSQMYTTDIDHNYYNSLYFQPAPKSVSSVDQSNLSAPQNSNLMFSNCSLSTTTQHYSNYYYQEGNIIINNNNTNNMLIFEGNNETISCTTSSSSDGGYGVGKDHLRHVNVKQEEDQMVGCNFYQGFLSENYQKYLFLLNHGDRPLFVFDDDQKAINGINILPYRELECDLEEIKELVSSSSNTTGTNGNGNMSLLFNNDDENYKTHETMMYYY